MRIRASSGTLNMGIAIPSIRRSAKRVTKVTLLCIICIYFVAAVLCEGFTSSSVNNLVLPVQQKVHVCCGIDFSTKEPVRCKASIAENDSIIRSKSPLTIPAHLTAENKSLSLQFDIVQAQCLSTDKIIVNLPLTFSRGRASLFLKNGYLKVETEYYHMDEYCINGKNHTSLELHVCPQDCRGPRPCIHKCCDLDKVYSFGFSSHAKRGCQNLGKGEYFSPTLYSDFEHPSSEVGGLAPHYIVTHPPHFKYECHKNNTPFFVFPKNSKTISTFVGYNNTGMIFRLRKDGKILYREADGKCSVIDPDREKICIDGMINYSGKPNPYFNNPEELVIFMCLTPPLQGQLKIGIIYGGLMIVSACFLLLTIAVYVLLWERQTVHGWTILSHTVCFFFMYTFLGIAHLIGASQYAGSQDGNGTGCFVLGMLSHFFFLATFSWLTIICLDLWLTFRTITPRRGTQSKGLSRYIKYSIVGWGVPITIVAVGFILSTETRLSTCTTSTVLIPGYGVYSCFLQEKAFGVYLYYPIAIMMTLNFVLFGVTSANLYFHRHSTQIATQNDTQEQFYRLVLKLFFVMGVPWGLEFISWFVSGTGVFWYWLLFDVLNILRAVAIFIIFVCKADIIWDLEQKHPWLKSLLIPFGCLVKEKRSSAKRLMESTHAKSIGIPIQSTTTTN